MAEKPLLGIGVIVENENGEVLFGKRTGSHAQKWSIPGGGLELGESFEEGARREMREEHGILIVEPKVIAVTNNLETYELEGVHSASVILVASSFRGEPTIRESDKCEEIMWANPTNLPRPHFDASRLAIECYLGNKFYLGISK